MKSLNIKLPIGNIFLQACGYFFVILLLLEFLARTTVVKRMNLYESYGSSHPIFDTQVVRIQSKFNQHKNIDCIFIGNSQTATGFNPSIIQEVYLKKTGTFIECQNFGLTGLEPTTAAPLAKLLIKKFHPSLIIFGTEMLDYTAVAGGADHSIMSSPWVKYQLGLFSIDGWLIDTSYAYRFYLGFNNNPSNDRKPDINGYLKTSNRTDETIETLANTIHEKAKNIKFLEIQIRGLHDLLLLNSENVKVLIVEMPVNPIAFRLEKNIQKIYPDFKNLLENETTAAGAELWLTKDVIKIPENGWYDFAHQNEIGSSYFSTFIGNRLADSTLLLSVKIP